MFIPFSIKADSLKLSRKKPLSSENDFASTKITSGISNFLNVNGMDVIIYNMINVFQNFWNYFDKRCGASFSTCSFMIFSASSVVRRFRSNSFFALVLSRQEYEGLFAFCSNWDESVG